MTRLCTCTGSLPSTLELRRKRNQLIKASCKICGGRPLVDGIGPVSSSMLSTVGLELTNFINPDLSWKTVTKGYRSTTRRSRKPVARSLTMGAELGDKSPKRLEDLSVLESEKFGVAVLGRRFADKIEDVPIKKRRLLLRSPSPPPRTPSPHREESLSPQPQTPFSPGESKQLLDCKCASGQGSCPDSFSNRQIRALDGSIAVKFRDGVDDGVIDGKISEVTNGKLGYTDDFSGIELLADAACYNNIGDDANNAKEDPVVEEFSTPEGFDSSTSTMPLKETITSSGTDNFFRKGLAHEDNLDGSFLQDNSVSLSQNLHYNVDGGAVRKSVPLKDDRLHWDLNTVMDAWEQPCDDPPVHFQRNVSEEVLDDGTQSEKLKNLEGCETLRNSEDLQYDLESRVQSRVRRIVSADVQGNHMLLDPNGMALGPPKPNIEERKLEASGPERTCTEEKCVSTPNECALAPLNYAGVDTKASSQVVSMDAPLDYSPCLGSLYISSTCVSEGLKNTACASIAVLQNREDCCKTYAMRSDVPVSEKAVCEITSIQSKDGEDFGKTTGLPDNRTSPREMISTVTCNTLYVENSVSSSDKVDPSHPSPKCEDLFASGASIGGGQPVVIGDAKGQDDRTSAADTIEIDSPLCVVPNVLMHKYHGDPVSNEGAQSGFISQESCKIYSDGPTSHSGKIALPFDDCYNLDVSQGDRAHMVGVENITEHQAGYDSPFEDGELRESVVYSWEENEVEEGETECVDYESDNRDRDDFDAADYSHSEEVEVGCEGSQIVEKGSSSVTKVMEAKTANMQLRRQFTRNDDSEKIEMVGKRGWNAGSGDTIGKCVKGDALKEASHSSRLKTNSTGWGQLQEHDELSADMTVEVNDVGSRKSHTSDHLDGFDVKGLLVGEVGSSASRGKLFSLNEGPPSSDVLDRSETLLMQRSRSHNLGNSFSRTERDFGSEKSMGRDRSLHVRDRIEGDGLWVDSCYWDSRNRYASSYRGLDGYGNTRPRSVIANSAAKVGGLNCHDRRHSINYSSKGMYRPPIRRRSPVDRDDCYDVHRGMRPVRGISSGRSRGRSGMYPRGVSRGPREEYHDPVPDHSPSSSVRMPHYLARRERSLSPAFSRGAHFSRLRRKSRSRSRTRSPSAWHLQRERIVGARRNSKSPDFRSEARTERMRLPFQKPSLAADYEESFMPPRRGRFSPQRNSRWFDDRNCVEDHSRDRRSPVRMFRRSQRFDSVGSSGRLKSDDYFRPMIRPVRFPLMAGSGRGRKYEDSDDDRRKHDDRYEIIHRVRRYDTGGVVRRFRYDAEECFEACNSHNEDDCIRGTERRDVPRSCREERRPSGYNNDRMYITAPSSGLRDYDEDA